MPKQAPPQLQRRSWQHLVFDPPQRCGVCGRGTLFVLDHRRHDGWRYELTCDTCLRCAGEVYRTQAAVLREGLPAMRATTHEEPDHA